MDADTIVRIAAKGEGVTRDGRFVALAAPGDRLRDNGAIDPGPHHAVPPCRHFPRCGGCQLQHVDDAAYRAFLADRVRGALLAQGIADGEILPPHLSPPRTRRRASLRAQRLGRTVLLGFNEAASHRIVDMHECHVLEPSLFALIAPLRALLGTLLPPRGQATVTLTLADQGVDLAIAGVLAEGLGPQEALVAFAGAHRLARLSVDDGYGLEPRWQPEAVTATFDGTAVELPPRAFLQATRDGEAAIVAAVRAAVGNAGAIADLFSGLGTFALPLARTAHVLAIEGARNAALALRTAANRAGRPVLVEHRDLFRRPLDAGELGRFAAVVLDPPRAGAREQCATLASAPVQRIAYVSCNPATFARDAAVLIGGGWRLLQVQPVGQFRWSTQVELVGQFAR